MRAMGLFFLFFLAGLLDAQPSYEGALGQPSRLVTAEESAQVQDYTTALSKDWLKKFFRIDVDVFELALRQFEFGYASLGVTPELNFGTGPQAGPTAKAETGSLLGSAPHRAYGFRLKLQQIGDIRHLAYDSRDVPFALKMDADRFFGGDGSKLQTSFSLPLTWKGEISARASLPLSGLDASGFGSNWRLSSIYSNRLGVSSVDTGLGTRWMGDWDIDFDSRVRFGQGIHETSQWLRFGRTF
jgi:hypothetical protein